MDSRFSQDPLQQVWDKLLSRQPALIRAAFAGLNAADQEAVLAHLRRMASEEGWAAAQRQSAQAALAALAPEGGPDLC